MNRRSFFAFLVGAPIAAVTGLKTKARRILRNPMKPSQWSEVISAYPFPEPNDEGTRDYGKIINKGDFVSLNDAGEMAPVSKDNPVIGYAIPDRKFIFGYGT